MAATWIVPSNATWKARSRFLPSTPTRVASVSDNEGLEHDIRSIVLDEQPKLLLFYLQPRCIARHDAILTPEKVALGRGMSRIYASGVAFT